MRISRLFIGMGVAVIFVLLVSFSTIISFVTDWWWFSEVGQIEVFVKPLITKIIIALVTTIIAAAFFLTNFLIAVRSKTPWVALIPAALLGQPVSLDSRILKKLGAIVCVVLSLFLGLITTINWQEILKFFSGVSFGEYDPIFKKDIAFYIFSLPTLTIGLGILRMFIVISLISSGIIYLLKGSLNIAGFLSKFKITGLKLSQKGQTEPKAQLHLGILLFLFLITTVVNTYFSLFNLLSTQSGPIFGAAFTDVAIMIPILKISIGITVLIAILTLFWGISGKLTPLITAISLYVFIGLASAIVPSLFQKLIVAPNELVKETPFIKNNIAATREAYGLDKIEEREISADKPLTSTDIASNNLTIKNVRLWDREQLLSTFSQIQEIRTYYEFISVDNDRYVINDEIRQIMLSPRELASESLPNRSWINEKLSFTHGYGLAAGPVNQVTAEGLPVLFVKDLPPKSEFKQLNINRPEIYYGEKTNDYVIVNTKSKEFDYPKGEENVYTTYQGKGGVKIDSLLKRLFFAIKFNSLKLFLSNDVTTESRILYYRNIKERVEKIIPFLTLDRDPYAVVADNKIYWIYDAYTKANDYPYSQPLTLNEESINYIRNSVKIVIDSYEGSINFYQVDTNDPIIRTYAKIFPNLFQPITKMPKSLISHLRYPEDIFSLQTAIYTIYHMDEPQIFYNKEDQWEIPTISEEQNQEVTDAGQQMGPRHMIMKLPGEKKEEFILMLPFTPRNKDNLSAWMVARNDGDSYGKIVVYRFPKQKLIFGPKQVIGRINQDAEVSRQISLWDQRGSQVIQGPLLVIPIEESLIYVRPLYLKAETGKIPELKRVIVAYENKIAMEETLEAALSRIFGTTISTQTQEEKTDQPTIIVDQQIRDLFKQAQELYDEAIRSQKEGNWALYGETIKRLGEILKRK
ncbi:hypothetical protein A2767_05215 [Candidatus Roizmanbacteria bacterium RIFCSPHIGHO2_01_FULL_35_10]|uniref:UPF0182 protein A3A74_05900 n=1 Tax=Candidatus Roizmanbacteria bacterium RIFCSPLOWO2_01_FULL_35_13 TaxID=1802055 RepID=A0A1F7IBX2_9BACT|nr:MAG: hypothetical protein A2767_05215 [Candidatus Roizmanbacteria bacterium RIFCSPHIGHO2_01_FULL_35_10]OGK40850.1 MAG: hypothetical protein A3A74_05900 [Candidatus Roizmanbacteria bacterium RIFCSPLOWO2_01_FULL_35_13]